MGVFSIISKTSGKRYLEATPNLRSRMNRAVFQLKFGSHPCKELQKEWNSQGESCFEVAVLDELPYSKDEGKKDYTEDLEELSLIWQEKLAQEGAEFY